jgi:molecular chaperone DnaK (HSP70)
LVDTWPDPKASNANRNKTPSVISYRNGDPHEWGFNAKKLDDPLRWAKILLQPENTQTGIQTEKIIEHTRQGLERIGKTAEEAVTDYLRYVWNFVIKKDLDGQFTNVEALFKLRVVVTVPAMWEPIARESTRRALRGAGIRAEWPIDIVTEPQAAALASYHDMKDFKQLKVFTQIQ